MEEIDYEVRGRWRKGERQRQNGGLSCEWHFNMFYSKIVVVVSVVLQRLTKSPLLWSLHEMAINFKI